MPSSTSEVALARRPQAALRWEKADTVLWAFTPEGIVLHNFARGLFVELDGPGEVVWARLDGAHAPEAIAEALREEPAWAAVSRARRLRFVNRLVANLADGGFLVGAA